tara:strand:- start:189 stop:746 length:558 start_codon:yes stop_codon:yes gene_type:complete
MLDYKYIYLVNLIDTFKTKGYDSLNMYDRYHILLTVLDYLTKGFNKNLGKVLKSLDFPESMIEEYPVLGFDKEGYNVPRLSDLSMLCIQRNRLMFNNNNHLNFKIFRTNELYSIHDKNNFIIEYVKNIYLNLPQTITTILINRYLRKKQDRELTRWCKNHVSVYLTSSESEEESEEEEEEYYYVY